MSKYGKCHCQGVNFGSYGNQVSMRHPSGEWVCIDCCIATEIADLWHEGVNTLGSCCGHRKFAPNVVVAKESYQKMAELGYQSKTNNFGVVEWQLKTKWDKE